MLEHCHYRWCAYLVFMW